MKFTLRQIEIFLATARHQNISRAAASLHMSQSAASEALQNLERAFELKLFDRMSNKLTLSASGQSLRSEAEHLIAQCQEFEKRLEHDSERGHISVAASFTIGNHLAPRYLSGYLSEHPDAKVQLNTANMPEVISQVLNRDVDIGMIESEFRHEDLELIAWRDDRLVTFCASNHPLAAKKVLRTSDIKSARWILREPDSGARYTFDRALSDLLPDINVYLEFKHNEAIKNAVESGLGIGCLSQLVLQKDFQNANLIPLQLPKRDMRRHFYFVLPRKRSTSPAIERWMANCIEMDQLNSTSIAGD